VVPDLATYEDLLLGKILAVDAITDARSTFAIRTVLSRGPLPLDQLGPAPAGRAAAGTRLGERC
jgi:Lrp/AsnC family leucine-responsive transcriptional regulator